MGNKKYIKVGRLIDGSGGAVQKDRVLVVQEGKIDKIVSPEAIPGQTSAEIIDLSHCSIMPPLMDCSVNLARSSSIDDRSIRENKAAEQKKAQTDIARHIHFCHTHGVLGVADFTEADQYGALDKQRLGSDDIVTIKTAGEVIATQADYRVEGDTPDYLKIRYSPGITSPEFIDTSPVAGNNEQLIRLVSSASSAGLKTVVAVNGERCVAEAIAAGCDAVEQGFLMNPNNLEEMAQRQIMWIPTLIMAKTAQELATGDREKHFKRLLDEQLAQLQQARTLGVPVAVGTGAGNDGIIHGEAVVEEIKLFIKAGYSLVEALRAASFNGAQFFNIESIGLLESGQSANFIVSRGMVQQLPRKLSYLENIFCNGAPSSNYRKNPVKTVHKVGVR